MKRKIAILLAAVMTTAMLPMNVFADSDNSINKADNVKDDEELNNVVLKIIPKDTIASGDSIVLSVTNGEFLGQSRIDKDFQWSSKVSGYETYDKAMSKYAAADGDFEKAFGDFVDASKSSTLPFKIVNAGKKTIDIKLFPIPQTKADASFHDGGKPAYYITLPVKASDAGDVKVKIDSNSTGIKSQEFTVANATSSSGSTVTTIDDVNTGNDDVTLEAITIKESVKNTFKSGETVTLKVSNGFVFSDNKKSANGVKVSIGSNLTFDEADTNKTLKVTDDEITFTMPTFKELNDSGKRDKLGSIKIENIKILPDDDDNDWGDISITVKGAGLTRETLKVGERADYGFKMTALEDPKTILAGRFSAGENDDAKNDDIYKRIDKDDCVAAEIKFEETIEDTWMTDRKLEFKVPDGVKIYDVEFDEVEKIDGGLDIDGDQVSISDDGSTLKIKGKEITGGKAKFKMKLYLSVDPNYTGDIALSVAGGGVASGVVDDVVIANAITPITIESSSTKANMGYQKINTSDITITEAQSGVLLKDGDVYIELDSVYGSKELGFADDGIDYEVNGDIEIKNFKIDDGVIRFKVDRESGKEPASIKIKNIKIGTTRSIPYGSYNFKVWGSSVINNYDENDNASGYKVDNKDGDTPGYFDTKSYKFPDYLIIQTETGTLDKVVKVTIDEKTILMDDKSYDMDVAPYIQTTSNSTMVPLRFVATALGVDADNISNPDESSKINWDANTKTVTIYYGSGTNMTVIKFVAGSNIMTINGTDVPMDYGVVAEINNDRMFVPFRALGTALGVKVSWNAETRTATYNEDIASASN